MCDHVLGAAVHGQLAAVDESEVAGVEPAISGFVFVLLHLTPGAGSCWVVVGSRRFGVIGRCGRTERTNYRGALTENKRRVRDPPSPGLEGNRQRFQQEGLFDDS